MSVRRDVRGYRDRANLRSRAADHTIHAIVEILNLHDRQFGFSGHNNTRMEVSKPHRLADDAACQHLLDELRHHAFADCIPNARQGGIIPWQGR